MNFSKHIIFILVVCLVGIIFIFGFRLQAENPINKENINLKEQSLPNTYIDQNRQELSNWYANRTSKNTDSNDNSDYYQAIIDNNIFRPLGWTPPNKEPEYTLIGTAVNQNGDRSKAFVLEERSNKFYVVQVGDMIGEAVVKGIEYKNVILSKNGENLTLQSSNVQFLNGDGSSGNSYSQRNENDNNDDSYDSNVRDEKRKMRDITKENEKKIKERNKQAAAAKKRLEQELRNAERERSRYRERELRSRYRNR